MIRFNELKIEDNYIIIDVQIEEEKYFKDMYIDSIVIDTQDTFIANGPSSKAIYTKTFNTNVDPIYYDTAPASTPVAVLIAVISLLISVASAQTTVIVLSDLATSTPGPT